MIPLITIVTFATLSFALSFFDKLYSLICCCVVLALCCFAKHGIVLISTTDSFGIYLHCNLVSQLWCMCTSAITLLHITLFPEFKTYSTASCLAIIGISLAYDLFHIYVWFEVLTFAFLGFAKLEKLTLTRYWSLQVIATHIILCGVMILYQETGTLMLSEALRGNAAPLWMLGILIKSGLGVWLAQGYSTVKATALPYVGSLYTKTALLPLMFCNHLGLVHNIGLLQFYSGFLLWLTTHQPMYFVLQTATSMIFLQHSYEYAIYLCLQACSEFWFLYRYSSCGALSVAGLPPSLNFFAKYSLLLSHPTPLLAALTTPCMLCSMFQSIKTQNFHAPDLLITVLGLLKFIINF